MNFMDGVAQARDAMSVKRVFGDAYEKDGVTIIPVAWVAGGGGGGGDAEGNGGGGFGLVAIPVGAYVIKKDEVTWTHSLNLTVIVVAGLMTLRTLVKIRSRKHR